MAHSAGVFALVRYNVHGRTIWHSRLVVAIQPAGPNTTAFINTPDDNSYTEELVTSGDILQVRWLSYWKSYPAAVRAGDVYEFATATS